MATGIIQHLILVQALDVLPFILTIIGNILCLLTLLKTRPLHTPANVFLGALCISDLFVGFIVQPLFLTNINARIHNGLANAELSTAEFYVILIGAGCSFTIGILISIDRYIAICHPFYHVRVADCKKYVLIVAVVSAFICTVDIVLVLVKTVYLYVCMLIEGVLCYFAVIFAYYMIYRVIRKQRRVAVTIGEIRGSTGQQIRKMHTERSRTYTILFVLLSLLICYLPTTVVIFVDLVFGVNRFPEEREYFEVWGRFSILLSSCFNPIIYCLRCKDVRKAAVRALRLNRIDGDKSTVAQIVRIKGENEIK